jgi:hypothetical protein
VLRLKLQRSTATGVIRSNKPRLLRTSDNKSMATFDNAGALNGEWPLDAKAGKTVQLKNNALDLKLELTQYRVPAVQLSGVAVNPHATYEGTSGTTVTFTTQANLPAALPPLEAWITYQPDNAESQTFLQSGKVTDGKGKADTTGAVVLDRTAPARSRCSTPRSTCCSTTRPSGRTRPSSLRCKSASRATRGPLRRKRCARTCR